MLEKDFWKNKKMDEFSHEEWEALCDGCGLCCLIKIMDEEGDEIFYTDVICRYHDSKACHCTVYNERTVKVPTCLVVTPDIADSVEWIPETCAYRLLAEGKDLPAWHPLVAGSSERMHERGNSVKGKVISETRVLDERLEEHIIFIWNEA